MQTCNNQKLNLSVDKVYLYKKKKERKKERKKKEKKNTNTKKNCTNKELQHIQSVLHIIHAYRICHQ